MITLLVCIETLRTLLDFCCRFPFQYKERKKREKKNSILANNSRCRITPLWHIQSSQTVRAKQTPEAIRTENQSRKLIPNPLIKPTSRDRTLSLSTFQRPGIPEITRQGFQVPAHSCRNDGMIFGIAERVADERMLRFDCSHGRCGWWS